MHHDRNIVERRGYGATAGDTWHLGLRTYDVIDPFAWHRDDKPEPMTNPFWRARIEKARKFRADNDAMWRVRDMAAALQPSVVKAFLKALNNGES
jgi:hypothetical protein